MQMADVLALLVMATILAVGMARAAVPAERVAALRRGINITHWFRFPNNEEPAYLRTYLSDADVARLKLCGFTFVRLAVQPELMRSDPARMDALTEAIGRIQQHGLGVMVGWHPQTWHLESSPRQQVDLKNLWKQLAPRLRSFDARLIFPEILNEPVFSDTKQWEALQRDLLSGIRRILPHDTVVLSGGHWGAADGLLALTPVADDNVVYSFHTYEPPVLTTLGAFEPGLDHRALTRLPFPASADRDCESAEHAAADQRTREVIRFYCAERWSPAKLDAAIREVGEWSRQHRVTVVAGEFGASSELPPRVRLAWVSAMRTALERQGIGWALWGYDDSMGFDIRPGGDVRALDPALLHALGLHEPG
jgi:hypothetical protein